MFLNKGNLILKYWHIATIYNIYINISVVINFMESDKLYIYIITFVLYTFNNIIEEHNIIKKYIGIITISYDFSKNIIRKIELFKNLDFSFKKAFSN